MTNNYTYHNYNNFRAAYLGQPVIKVCLYRKVSHPAKQASSQDLHVYE